MYFGTSKAKGSRRTLAKRHEMALKTKIVNPPLRNEILRVWENLVICQNIHCSHRPWRVARNYPLAVPQLCIWRQTWVDGKLKVPLSPRTF